MENRVELFESEKDCCGCTACVSICPKNAIMMNENRKGFLVPEIDENKCVNCMLCQKVCNFKKFKPTEHEPKVFAFRYLKNGELEKSQSGGAAAAISDKIIMLNGCVFGSQVINGYDIVHKVEYDKKGCKRFKGSKYVQSNMNNCFNKCKEELLGDKYVLFTGTGCQIHGLLSYLHLTKTPLDKLFTMDIICHGVPGQGIWKQYIKELEKKLGHNIVNVNFRDKNLMGWRGQIEKYELDNNTSINLQLWSKIYQRCIIFRDSCYNCKYTTTNRESDFTVGDYWGVENYFPQYDDNKGISIILVHSKKGEALLSEIKQNNTLVNISVKQALQPNLQNPSSKSFIYNIFWKKYDKNPQRAIRQFILPSVTTSIIFPLLSKLKRIIQI